MEDMVVHSVPLVQTLVTVRAFSNTFKRILMSEDETDLDLDVVVVVVAVVGAVSPLAVGATAVDDDSRREEVLDDVEVRVVQADVHLDDWGTVPLKAVTAVRACSSIVTSATTRASTRRPIRSLILLVFVVLLTSLSCRSF
jgi:hypothetical protein